MRTDDLAPCESVPGSSDVVVCGGGPAGFAAAVAAARTGASTTLLEVHGCLGGVWTAGALALIIDAGDKPGIMAELTDRLDARDAHAGESRDTFVYDIEIMKLVLEEMVSEAGVRVQLHSRVVATMRDRPTALSAVVTESKSGRQAWTGRVFVDATGDGDLAAYSGCRFEIGHPDTGAVQPMSLMAIVAGIRLDQVAPFVSGGLVPLHRRLDAESATRYAGGAGRLLAELRRADVEPSYKSPSLWAVHEDVFALMANHEYGVSAVDAAAITEATMRARAEIHELIDGLRSLGGVWNGVRVLSTAEQIGVREGRRIVGRYRVTEEDIHAGRRHHDAVARVNFGIDIHSLTAEDGGYLDDASILDRPLPGYDIPMRALLAQDVDNLLLAGRCISGDFAAHASYRVTGNAVATGQAAGVAAALAAASGGRPQAVAWDDIALALGAIGSGGRVPSSAGSRP